MSEPRLTHDPSTGRPVLRAPGRRSRPILTAPEQQDVACPFCPGAEDRTPPERDAVRRDGAWTARAFENLYPAAAWHEVIVEGSEHAVVPGALDARTWVDTIELWQRRIRAMEADPEVALAFLFKNVGRAAGSSIPHNHSQMLGMPILPPRLVAELEACRGGYAHLDEVEGAEADGRLIARTAAHIAICPRVPKLPFETWVLPLDPSDDFLEPAGREDLADLLEIVYGAIDRAFDEPPLNSCLHRIPGEAFHWHFEIQPRNGQLAALEVGGDMSINSVTAQAAAERIRGGLRD